MQTAAETPPRFLDAGEGGLIVEFGNDIDEGVNRRVVALDRAIARLRLGSIRETVPTYRSLLVLYDPLSVSRRQLVEHIISCANVSDEVDDECSVWRVPVCYGGEHGVDLEEVARAHRVASEELVAIHSSASYRVYMIGFAPGFTYLGGLPEAIHTSRRTDPRATTPPRSISIGGRQAAVAPPMGVPSGWHLLGRTPVRSYDPRREEKPFLFSPGDRIRFRPVSVAEYNDMLAAAEAGDIVAELVSPATERAGG